MHHPLQIPSAVLKGRDYFARELGGSPRGSPGSSLLSWCRLRLGRWCLPMSWEGSFLSNPFLQDSGKSVMVQTQDGFLPLTQGSRLFLFSLPASSVFHSYLEVTRFLIFSPCIRVLVLLWRRIQLRLSLPLAVAGISSSNLPMRVLSYFFLYPEFSS